MSNRKNHIYPPFVALTQELFRDPTWISFSNKTKLLWIYLRKQYGGGIDTRIRFGPAMARAIMSQRSYRSAMKELRTVKWIEIDYTEPVNNKGLVYKLKGPHSYFIHKGHKLL
jgi:hypothetical protein